MKNIFQQITFLSLILFGFVISFAQEATKPVLTLEVAKQLAAAAENEAAKNNLSMVISILDDGGNLLYFERMNSAQLGSIDVALAKARTALYFKRSTKSYQDRVAGGDMTLLKVPNVIPVEGGLPLIVNDQIIGSVGVSGGTPQQDGMVAQAAINAFQTLHGSK
ncbi:MAG: heme-binding protein [Bacteroidetes bacterium]|nr:heme-binding protein [Bacteroidota bacterium]